MRIENLNQQQNRQITVRQKTDIDIDYNICVVVFIL